VRVEVGRWYRAALVDDIGDLAYQALGALSRDRRFRGVHRLAYEVTGGRWIAGRSLGVETILLTVSGRRSGRPRALPLYGFAADVVAGPYSWAVVATNGGAQVAPGWYLDLASQPRAIVQHRTVSLAIRARDATPGEAASLWPTIVAAYPGYEGYRRRRAAGAPVVLLVPEAVADAVAAESAV
jgi:deazaflavin-dependent oxidoreductase (nitroreductase family)